MKRKTVPSAGKIMTSVVWDASGIILIDYVQRRETTNGVYYANLLQRLSYAIKKAAKKVLFHAPFPMS